MEFLILATAHFLALLSPGTDFFIIVSTALRRPLKYAFTVSIGIVTAHALYLCIAVLGLESIKHISGLMETLRYLGGIYLLYIGFMLIKAPKVDMDIEIKKPLHVENLKSEFIKGFLSAFLNPKNIIFYLSLFTTLVSVSTPLYMRSLYALWMCSLVLFWDIGISLMVGNKKVKNRLSSYIFRLEKIAGVILGSFGLLLIFGTKI
jgi:threonine/homoserine/homoserine lactone efflux protein